MLKRRSVFWLLGGALSLARSGPAAAAGPPPRSVLEGVKALAQPVTYTETKIPLGELVQKVAADTGAALTAAPEVADEPVAVVVKDLPARELLEQLADLLDYRWSRRSGVQTFRHSGVQSRQDRPTFDFADPERLNAPTPTFEIWQDLASKQREEALRQAVFAEAEKEFQEGVERAVEMAALPPERIRQILEEEEKRERERAKLPPEEQEAIRDSPAEQERVRRVSPAVSLWSPIGRALANLLAHLTPRQWALLRRGQPLILSTDPKSGGSAPEGWSMPLPVETAQALRSSPLSLIPPWLSPVPPDEKLAESIRQQAKKSQEQWAGASGYQVAIVLEKFQLTMSATPLQEGAPLQDFWGGGGSSLQVIAAPSRPALASEEATDSPQRRAGLERDPVFGARKLFRPEAKPTPEAWAPTHAVWGLRDLLPDLARTYGVQFIADAYYWGGRSIDAERLSPSEPAALFTLLDRLVGTTHRWDHDGKLVRLRSRTWFSDRPREIPLRLIRRWKSLCDQDGVLPLREQLAMLATLTEAQWETVDLFQATLGETGWATPGTFRDNRIGLPPGFLGAREALRLLAALTPAQQQALWSGRMMPVTEMSPPQRELFMAPFRQRQGHLIEGRQAPWPPPDEKASGLSLALEPRLLFRQQRGPWTIYRTEPAPHAGSAPAALRTSGSTDAPPPPMASPGAGASPATPPDSVRSYPVTRVEFDFQYGPDHRESPSITIPSPP
jgi:hypothetical protein